MPKIIYSIALNLQLCHNLSYHLKVERRSIVNEQDELKSKIYFLDEISKIIIYERDKLKIIKVNFFYKSQVILLLHHLEQALDPL